MCIFLALSSMERAFDLGRDNMKKAISFLLILITIFSLIGCSEKPVSDDGKVNIIISKDFGDQELFNKVIDFQPDKSVMEIMDENLEIETAYGGGFINSINGLKSGFTGTKNKQKQDWFYYINGMLAQVGSDDYYPRPGDVVIWDYHDWSSSTYISSIIGAYPGNFVIGCRNNVLKTEIYYSEDYKNESAKLAEFLKDTGLKDLDLVSLDKNELENEEINLL